MMKIIFLFVMLNQCDIIFGNSVEAYNKQLLKSWECDLSCVIPSIKVNLLVRVER